MNASLAGAEFMQIAAGREARHGLQGTWRVRRRFAAALLVMAGALLSAPVAADTAVESAVAFINHYRQAARGRDLPATMACFSEDITLFPPEGPTVVGKAAVKALYEDFFKSSDSVDNEFAEERTFAGDTVAVHQGISTYRERSRADGQIRQYRTRFVMVLVRQQGQWQLATYAWQDLKPGG